MWLNSKKIILLIYLFAQILFFSCATTSTQNNRDYLSLFFDQNETKKEFILINIQRIVEEFALIINDQNLAFKEGKKFEIIRNNEPIGLANVVKIEGEKVVLKATLDNKNDNILLNDKIQYIIF